MLLISELKLDYADTIPTLNVTKPPAIYKISLAVGFNNRTRFPRTDCMMKFYICRDDDRRKIFRYAATCQIEIAF